MLKDIVEVQLRGGYRLYLRFEDGVEGEIDVSRLVPFEGVFALLQDPKEFSKVRVNTELGTIEWPNGADLDPGNSGKKSGVLALGGANIGLSSL